MGSGALVAGATAAGASATTVVSGGDPLARVAILGGLTPFQQLILSGYGGGVFLLALGCAGVRWPTRTMRLAAMASIHGPARSPSPFRKQLFRAFSVGPAGLGLLLLAWTTTQWL